MDNFENFGFEKSTFLTASEELEMVLGLPVERAVADAEKPEKAASGGLVEGVGGLLEGVRASIFGGC